MSKTKFFFFQALPAVVIATLLVVTIIYAWTEPTVSPPGGNVSTPLNTSINAQSKEGALIVGANSSVTTGLIVRYGKVGIGTTEPLDSLHISASDPHILVDFNTGPTGNFSAVEFGNQGTLKARLQYQLSTGNFGLDYNYDGDGIGSFMIYNNQVAKLTILNNGNVGIGTTNPTEKLHVTAESYSTIGNRHLAGTAGAVIEGEDTGLQIIGQDLSEWMAHLILSGVPASGDNKHWIMYHSGPLSNNALKIGYKTSSATDFDASLPPNKTYFAITPNGNVGINMGEADPWNWTDPWEKLVVYGNIWASGWIAEYSDVSLKQDVKAIPDALQRILSLEGVSYIMKDTGKLSIGLVAQEVEKVFPELVITAPNTGLKSLQYGHLVAPLIEAIKEQQSEIDSLRAEIKELKDAIKK